LKATVKKTGTEKNLLGLYILVLMYVENAIGVKDSAERAKARSS
jgi:hypothetical protein